MSRYMAAAILAFMARSASPQQPAIVYLGGSLGTPTLIDPDRTNQVAIAVPLAKLNSLRWSRNAALITAEGVDLNQQGATTQIFNFDRAGNYVAVTNLAVPGYTVLKLFSAFSPNGDRMAVTARFVGQQSQQGLLLTYAFDGTRWSLANTVGTLNAACAGCAIDQLGTGWGVDWSPNNDLVITPLENLAACPGSPIPAVYTEIFSAPPLPGATFTPITTASRDAACAVANLIQYQSVLPVFSPDGTTIAYVQWARGSSLISTIRLVSLNGANDRPLLAISDAQIFALDWSPDGAQLIYDQMPIVNGVPDFANATVSIIPASGAGGPTRFLGPPAAQPAWSKRFPVPKLAALAPTQAIAGGAPFTLMVSGSDFASSSVVAWNGTPRKTTFTDPEHLQAAILANDIAQPGTAQVSVSNPPPGGGTSGSLPITIAPAAATQLAFTGQPTNTLAGTAITPAVQVTALDAQGNTATGFAGNVTVALGANPGGGTLAGTTTVMAVNGVATFSDLGIHKAGTGYTLAATAAGLLGTTSHAFDVLAAAATQLVFSGQPTNATVGATITPPVQVTARDGFGNTATSFTGNVTVALEANPGGGMLSGTAMVAAVNGVATFPNLSVDKAGTGYTLAASAAGLTGATSGPFAITSAAAPAVTLSTNTVTFGAQLVGTTSAAQAITLRNSGTAPLSITGVSVTKNGAEVGTFAETDNCVGTIAAGASCAVSVTFKATGVGAASGTLTINDNAANTPQTVDLAATGSDYSIATAAGGSTTATVVAGQTATYHLAVQPSGYSGTLSLTCSGAPPAATCSPSPANLDVSATTPAPFTISVGTAARAQTAAGMTGGPRTGTKPTPGLGPLLVVLALLGMLLVRDCLRLPLRARSAAAVTLLLAVALSHCGSGGAPTQPSGGTPAGTYTLVVTGASGGVTRTINLTLQVN